MKINKKTVKYGTVAAVITVAVIALVILVNVIITLVSDRTNMVFDLTPGGDFAISEETKNYLASLTEDVEICATVDEVVFQSTDNKYLRQGYEVLKKYAMNSSKISLRFIDMTVNPTYVEKYKNYYSGNISSNSIVLFNNSTHQIKVVSVYDLFNTEINYYTMSQDIVSSKAEKVLTSALMYITDPDPKTAVILDVKTSSSSTQNIQTMLEDDGFNVITVNPLSEAIPSDAHMIVINSPMNDLSADIVASLYEFMENGGQYGKNMIYIASIYQNETPNLDAFLSEWGVKVIDGTVVDNNTQNSISGSGGYGFITYIGNSGTVLDSNEQQIVYTSGIPADTLSNPVAVYFSKPVEPLFEFKGTVSVATLLKTAGSGTVITSQMIQDYQDTGIEPVLEEREVSVMTLSSKFGIVDNRQVFSNLLVIGSDNMVSYDFTSQTYLNNGDYFLSIINKLSGKENGVNILDKDLTSTKYQATESQIGVLRTLFIFVLPGLTAALGIFVWLRRRHK